MPAYSLPLKPPHRSDGTFFLAGDAFVRYVKAKHDNSNADLIYAT